MLIDKNCKVYKIISPFTILCNNKQIIFSKRIAGAMFPVFGRFTVYFKKGLTVGF